MNTGDSVISITTPLTEEVIASLHAGDRVSLSGILWTARDAAHKKMAELIDAGAELPFDISGQIIYYTGVTPARPGFIAGSAGPTTSMRMDGFTPALLERGLTGTIGKGPRGEAVCQAMLKHRAVYLAAPAGCGALLGRKIKEISVIAYPELGPEAVRRIVVEAFPAVVINDIYGGDFYRRNDGL